MAARSTSRLQPMANKPVDDDALFDLRSSLAEEVASLARPSIAHSRPRARRGEHADVSPAPGGPGPVGLAGGVVYLDDERTMRRLAREIKRLIIEDVRRGIDV